MFPIRQLALATLLVLTPLTHAQLPAGTTDASARPAPVDAQGKILAAANDALDKGDFARALPLLQSYLEQGAGGEPDAHVLYDLAYTQEALDQPSRAETSYRAAIAASPTLTEAHLALGLLLARTGHSPDARTELLAAANTPTAIPALRGRALRALARLDLKSNPDAAREELLAALKLTPETPDDTQLAAELAEAEKDPAAAEKAYRRTLATTPNDPAATSALARIVAHTSPAEAETLLNSALAARPDDPALTAQLATLYANQGKFAQAIPLAEKLHSVSPQEPAVTRLLAHLYAASGDPAQADPLFAQLLAAKPDAQLLDDRGEVLTRLRRYAEAEVLLKQAVADPASFPTKEDFGMAASHLAFAATNNNDPTTALRALALRATVLPQSPSALFLGAIAHDKLHEFRLAADLYKQFLASAGGKFPDEEFEARHRLIALEKTR